MERKMTRRKLLASAAMAGTGVLIAACARPAPEKVVETVIVSGTPQVVEKEVTAAPVPEEKKVQVYSLEWLPDGIAALTNAVDTFNAANKGRVQIELIQGSWGNARDYLTTSIAGGVVPE
ncbi:MAG: hypothetical protein QME94_19405, partial [Anaerolineae bacterium]|nr:hypothetical protein [Anaerolineae bacterium]